MAIHPKGNSIILLMIALTIQPASMSIFGQDDSNHADSTEASLTTDNESVGVTFGEPSEYEWELGVKITAKGKAKHRKSGTSHLQARMSTKRKRNLRGTGTLDKCMEKSIREALNNNSY